MIHLHFKGHVLCDSKDVKEVMRIEHYFGHVLPNAEPGSCCNGVYNRTCGTCEILARDDK